MDLAEKYGGEKTWITIDCGDGDTFKVLIDPRVYTFDQQLDIWAKLEVVSGPVMKDATGEVVIDPVSKQPRRELTTDALRLMIDWGAGYILDFDNLTIEGKKVEGVDGFAQLKRFPEVVGIVFNGVMEAVGPKKPSATGSNDGSTQMAVLEVAQPGQPVS